jgi:hypothetical protein
MGWPKSGMRRLPSSWLLFIALSVTYLGVGGYWIWEAPGGWWANRIFDFPMYLDNDPGGWYIPSAHELLSRPGHTCFGGHPGLSLQVLLLAEQAALYAGAWLHGTPYEFTPYIAHHIMAVWKLAKLSMIVLHLISFLLLYECTRLLTRKRFIALGAVAIYATSFPVLYYLNRVGVEPLVNIFFLATVVCLVRAEETSGRFPQPEAWSMLGGACAALAFFTKIHLMAAWPLLAGAALIVGGRPGLSPSRRLRTGLAYAAGLAALGWLCAGLVNWPAFTATWTAGGANALSLGAADRSSATLSVVQALPRTVGVVLEQLVQSIRQTSWRYFLPGCTPSRSFFFFEFLAGLAVAVGTVRWLRRRRSRTRWPLWIAALCCFSGSAWFYRSGGVEFTCFHYLFPVLAAAAPLAALGVATVAPGLVDPTRSRTRRALELLAVVAALHGSGVLAVLDSKMQDRQGFADRRAAHYWAALEQIAPGERVLILGGGLIRFHGLSDTFALPTEHSTLIAELTQLFSVKAQLEDRDPQAFARRAGRRGFGSILDFRLSDPGPWPLSEWREQARLTPQ